MQRPGSPRPFSVSNRRSRGFTLIELMVVIVILGLLVALVVPNVFRQESDARIDATIAQMGAIAGAVDLYRLRHHALPARLELLTEPDARSGEPFLRRLPMDGWGGAFTLHVESRSPARWSIRSAGPDGVALSEDDLEVPEPDHAP